VGIEAREELVCERCGRSADAEARFCSHCGAPLAAPLREERRLVSILFVDLEGFTAAAEQADPEDVRETLTRFHAAAREQIEAYGGRLEKFIGDAVMAVFGAPLAHGDDAERAVRAGLRLLTAVDGLQGSGPRLAARAAVNTGEALVTMGRPEAGEAFAIGDVVNTAARLQTAAPAGRLVVGRETQRATRHAVEYEALPPVDAKGKAEPVEVWLAVRPLVEPSERPARLGPFVGRARELDVVRSVWRQSIHERRPQLVTVVGPPGIGKSRLVREVGAEIQAAGGLVLRGRCVPYEERTGYHASAQLVRQAFGIFDSDPEQVAREKLVAGVALLLPPAEAEDTTRYLALLLGLGTDAPVVTQRLLFLALRRVLEGLGAERPVLVVYEDIHWAATSELDLIEYLGGQLRETGCAVMALTRPELLDERPWGARLPAHTSLVLGPLAAEDVEAMANALVADATPDDVVDRLVARAEGNPLFVEELAAGLADGTAAGALPVTVTAAIDARLDALPATLRSHVLVAAVVGRTFWRDVLAAVAGDDDLDEALDELERRDLVRREPTSRLEGDVEYRFRHALIRDVAYATLTRSERAARHAGVAAYVEGRAAGDTGPIAWVLAHHWRAAGEPRRAVPHLLAAAAVAERGWATREVVDLYSLAAELADDERERASIRLRRGIALKALDADHEAAAELAAVVPSLDGTERLDGLLYAGRAEVWCERHEEALGYAEQALAYAEELGDPDGRAAALGLLSDALAMRGDAGDLDRALALGDEALAGWRTGVRGYEHADHLHLQSDVKYWTGDYAGSARCASRAREVAGDVRSAHQLLRGGGMDAMASVGMGHHEVALEKLAAMMEIARELGTAGAYLPNYQSVVFREVFDLDAARAASEAALEASRELAFGMPRRFALADLLQTALLEGDVDRAAADWPELWEDASTAAGWTRWLVRGRLAVARAEIAVRAAPAAEAAEWAAQAVELTKQTRRAKYEAQARSLLGRALAGLGRRDEAIAELRRAVELADWLVNPAGRWHARAALADVLTADGDEAGAEDAAHDARAILTGFAEALAPARAATLLAAPPVRALLA